MSVEAVIREKLQAALVPDFLTVENESHGHRVPQGAETHFKVVVVAQAFEGLRPVARHQKVYQVLALELQQGVHALALHTYTPSEWQAQPEAPVSPACMGKAKG